VLRELHVRDLALIDEAWLEFGPGMNVISGETGAGKTALVGALKLLLGGRAESGMIRSGAREALVEGVFEHKGRESVVKRRIGVDGRSRCSIDGEMTTVAGLATELAPLVDMHGQHEHQALLSPGNHVSYLDRYIGTSAHDAKVAFREARASFFAARTELEALLASLDDTDRERARLESIIADIDSVAPCIGEDVGLSQKIAVLQHGGKLVEASAEAYARLQDEGGAAESAALALMAIAKVSDLDPRIDALRQRLEQVSDELNEMAVDLRIYGEGLEHDQEQLDFGHNRLAVLALLKKKYGSTLEDVMQTRHDAADRLAMLEDSEYSVRVVTERTELFRHAYITAAEELTAIREGAFKSFQQKLDDAVADLAMDGARFEVLAKILGFDAWTSEGPQRIEFMYSSGSDQLSRPLVKIASGGELSRVMLALKGVLGAADPVPVLVFDEVDSGIGGATANSVGRRLGLLSMRHQVLVVTHLAQVASYADHHLVVTKTVDCQGVKTRVTPVVGADRTAEIARMLGGRNSEAGLAHAAELLAAAKCTHDRSV